MRPSRLTQFRRQHGRRMIVVLALVVSLGLLSLSIGRLLRAQRETKAVNVTVQRLSRDIEAMTRELDVTDAPQAFEALRLKEQELLVSTNRLAGWIEQLVQRGVPLVLEVAPQAGVPFTGALAERGVRIVPVTVDVAPTKGLQAVSPTYHRLLQFLAEVSRQEARADLVGLEVVADTGGIERATAAFNVWVGEPAPAFATAPAPAPPTDQP